MMFRIKICIYEKNVLIALCFGADCLVYLETFDKKKIKLNICTFPDYFIISTFSKKHIYQ